MPGVDVAPAAVGANFKVRLGRHEVAEAVAWAARSLPARPTEPVMGCVRISGDRDAVKIAAYDGEVSMEVEIHGEIDTPETVVVSGRLLAEITRLLPAKPVDLTSDGTRLVLTCGSSRFSLPMMPVETYPVLPTPPAETGVVSAELFSEAIAQVAVAAGRDDMLTMLCGVRIEICDDKMVLVATDRFRLAMRELSWSPVGEVETAVIVPARALAEAAKTLPPGEDVQLSLGIGDELGSKQLLGLNSGSRRPSLRP